MNKSGFLLAEETLKIIVSLIAIGFLVYLLASLYLTNVNGQKKAHADSNLGRITDVIKNVNLAEEDVTQLSPAGWFLFSFVEEKPNLCAGENCLCICDNIFLGLGNQERKCNKEGVCEVVPNLESFGPIEIKSAGQTSVHVSKTGEKILITEIK